MLTKVNVVHVQQGQNVSVLVSVQGDTDFIEEQFYVESRSVIVHFVIYPDLLALVKHLEYDMRLRYVPVLPQKQV